MESKFKKPLLNFLKRMEIGDNNYAITGSLAVQASGFKLNREINDIDILIPDLKGTKSYDILTDKLGLLSQSYKNSDYPDGKPFYKFLWDGIIFNIFVLEQDKFSSLIKIYDEDHIPYSNIISILEAKSQYKRVKDLKDITHFISQMRVSLESIISKL